MIRTVIEKWPLKAPFRITGYTFEYANVLVVTVERNGLIGRGEGSGVYYLNDTPPTMLMQIEAIRDAIDSGVSRQVIQTLLPPGGARNALDCALWDLEARSTDTPVWKLAGLEAPRPLLTTHTVGVGTPEEMAAGAVAYTEARAIKVKLNGDGQDAERVKAVRAARPGVWMGVDANQGFTRDSLEKLLPTLVDCQISLVEQPFKVGEEALLEGFDSPIPIAADESLLSLKDLPRIAPLFDTVNIKLDKCGGLTEALAIAREAKSLGLGVMVGNMVGTSLSMAPAFVLGQLCDVVDLDGPLFLTEDRTPGVVYKNGEIFCPGEVWGG
jgi:L-alanine-DL-glutamate epimerase-like enolase superfamily enzyme